MTIQYLRMDFADIKIIEYQIKEYANLVKFYVPIQVVEIIMMIVI